MMLIFALSSSGPDPPGVACLFDGQGFHTPFGNGADGAAPSVTLGGERLAASLVVLADGGWRWAEGGAREPHAVYGCADRGGNALSGASGVRALIGAMSGASGLKYWLRAVGTALMLHCWRRISRGPTPRGP